MEIKRVLGCLQLKNTKYVYPFLVKGQSPNITSNIKQI